MRALLATAEYPPDTGGVARYLGALGELAGIAVASPHGPIKLRSVWLFPPRWLPLVWRLPFLANREKADLLLISHILPFGYGAITANLFGIKYMVICHGLDLTGPLQNSWKRFWVRLILRRAALVVTNSQATAQLARAFNLSDKKIVVINPPLSWEPDLIGENSESEIIKSHGLAARRCLLIAGRLVKRKGADIAIRAMAQIVKKYPDAALVLAGEGPERTALEIESRKANLSRHVIFTGRVTDSELRDLYRAAEIILYPSRAIAGDFEGWGMGAADAGLFAKPVIASELDGLKEAVVNEVSGLLVKPGDKDELANSILRLFSDSAKEKKLGCGGHELATERGIETFRNKFREAINQILH